MRKVFIMSKEDKKTRNKVELVTLGFFTVGAILFALTKCPLFVYVTLLSVPFCFWKPVNKWLG